MMNINLRNEMNIFLRKILIQYYYDGYDNYSYILYDKTPGGAGHVKRLNNQDVLTMVLKNAYRLVKNCSNCDEDSSCYSCLRTYYNQKKHDKIKHSYVIDYLGQILGGVK